MKQSLLYFLAPSELVAECSGDGVCVWILAATSPSPAPLEGGATAHGVYGEGLSGPQSHTHTEFLDKNVFASFVVAEGLSE